VTTDLLFRNATVLTMDPDLAVLENADVAIEGARIVHVGPATGAPAKRVVDATGKLVMPGLINCHTHAAMTLMRGLADDMALDTWWQKFIFPIENKLVDAEFVGVGTELAALEMLRSGTTSFVDMYFFEDAAAEACRQIGIRAFLGEVVLDFPTPDSPTPDDALRTIEALDSKWRGDPTIHVVVAPHAPYSCSEPTLLSCRALADRLGLPLHIHISETAQEVVDSRGLHGLTPVQFLDGIGLLDERVLAAHCVHVVEADLEILRRRQVKVAHCPESQMKLASGVAPVPSMLGQGIIVGIGTDGAASNNDLNLWGEMRAAAMCHKLVRLDPTAMNARDVVKMATCQAARAVRRPDLGSIEQGKTADVIMVDLQQPQFTPLHDIYSHLVYAASGAEVDTAVVNGRLVMEGRRVLTVDQAEILDRAARIGRAIRNEVYA
jgi:5-methylthioadenosine/S-adenosylhomocysteine deaminase